MSITHSLGQQPFFEVLKSATNKKARKNRVRESSLEQRYRERHSRWVRRGEYTRRENTEERIQRTGELKCN